MNLLACQRPVVAPGGLFQRPRGQQSLRGQLQPARAEPFNEGAAQVRRLVDRDRKELNLDELEATFAEDPAVAPSSAAAADASSSGVKPAAAAPEPTPKSPFQVNSTPADKTPVSPFGPSSSSSGGSTAFGSAGGTAKRPFAEPAGLSPYMPMPQKDTAPWWTKITTTQIVIVLSFTTIISTMIGTFFFVLSTGAIRFNE